MDRASGSGSFARDPDALITLTPLRLTDEARAVSFGRPAFLVEGTLREFAPFEPFGVWFDHPVHVRDDTGTLAECATVGSPSDSGRKGSEKRNAGLEEEHARITELLDGAWDACAQDNEDPTLQRMYERLMGTEYKPGKLVSYETLRNWMRAAWCPYSMRGGAIVRDGGPTGDVAA